MDILIRGQKYDRLQLLIQGKDDAAQKNIFKISLYIQTDMDNCTITMNSVSQHSQTRSNMVESIKQGKFALYLDTFYKYQEKLQLLLPLVSLKRSAGILVFLIHYFILSKI